MTTNNQAIYFNTVEDLYDIVSKVDKYPLFAVAENLKLIAIKQYTWENISNRYANVILGKESSKEVIFELEKAIPMRKVGLEQVLS